MDQTMANVGNVNENWKRWVLVWLLSAGVVWVVAGIALYQALTGTAGLFFLYWGVRSLLRTLSSRSVEEATIGSLGGRSAPVPLVGDARALDEPRTAPLSGEDCVAYQVQVEEYSPNRGGE